MSMLASIYPNRISVRYERENKATMSSILDRQIRLFDKKRTTPEQYEINLKKKRESFKLSYQTKSKIKDSVQILYQHSPARVVKNGSKIVYNKFRASFITLTLPSEQKHTDIEIKQCLNRFLVNLRKVYKLENYVWKAELQKNKNIHFHIIIDRYIHHSSIRYYWCKAIERLGYIEAYRKEWRGLTLTEYCLKRNISKTKGRKGYNYGNNTDWSNPPVENVSLIQSVRMLSNYLSKYIAKSDEGEADTERIKSFGRVWARSQSLSRYKVETRWNWSNLREIIKGFHGYKRFFYIKKYDYCTIIYFDFKKISKEFRNWIDTIFKYQAKVYDYPIPI